jgi:hypothetical protein
LIAIADLTEKGLAPVRAIMERDGKEHFENSCRVDVVGDLMRQNLNSLQRYDLEFVTLYIHKKNEEQT